MWIQLSSYENTNYDRRNNLNTDTHFHSPTPLHATAPLWTMGAGVSADQLRGQSRDALLGTAYDHLDRYFEEKVRPIDNKMMKIYNVKLF